MKDKRQKYFNCYKYLKKNRNKHIFLYSITKMDILYNLPLPKEICSKIIIFACKSPHTGLSSTILKKIIGLHFYNIFNKNGDIKLDGDGNVVEIWNNIRSFIEQRKLTFDISHLNSLPNLIKIYLDDTGVFGDIENLKSLPNLTEIRLDQTGVSGNISHLKLLPNLTKIFLGRTGVFGDIENLKSLSNLIMIDLYKTGVIGNIVHMKSLINLDMIDFENTGVTGEILHLKSLPNLTAIGLENTYISGDDKKTFYEYREISGLPKCNIYF